jgi:hypothetical protein
MRHLLLLALTAVLGCAPGSGAAPVGRTPLDPPPEPPPAAESAGAGYYVRLNRDDGISVAGIDGSQQAVYQALLRAFDTLGLEIEGGDRGQGLVQSARMVRMSEFAGVRMSELIHCGATLTGDRANSWRIEFYMSALVEPLGDHRSQITTRLQATARAMDGSSRNPISCTTRGVLEAKLAEATAAELRSGRP